MGRCAGPSRVPDSRSYDRLKKQKTKTPQVSKLSKRHKGQRSLSLTLVIS